MQSVKTRVWGPITFRNVWWAWRRICRSSSWKAERGKLVSCVSELWIQLKEAASVSKVERDGERLPLSKLRFSLLQSRMYVPAHTHTRYTHLRKCKHTNTIHIYICAHADTHTYVQNHTTTHTLRGKVKQVWGTHTSFLISKCTQSYTN